MHDWKARFLLSHGLGQADRRVSYPGPREQKASRTWSEAIRPAQPQDAYGDEREAARTATRPVPPPCRNRPWHLPGGLTAGDPRNRVPVRQGWPRWRAPPEPADMVAPVPDRSAASRPGRRGPQDMAVDLLEPAGPGQPRRWRQSRSRPEHNADRRIRGASDARARPPTGTLPTATPVRCRSPPAAHRRNAGNPGTAPAAMPVTVPVTGR